MRTKLQLCDSADLCHQCNGNFGQILLEIKLIRQKAVQIGISRRPEVFLGKGVLKICSKFTPEQPTRSVIFIKLLCDFIEITLRLRCSPVTLLHIFRTPFPKNTSRRLVLKVVNFKIPTSKDLPFQSNNTNNRKRCEICSKLTILTVS